jgi:hypothetical protein
VLTAAAYGFRIAGGPEGRWLAARGAERWPLLRLERDPGVPAAGLARVDGAALHAAISPEVSEDEVLHPLLGRMLSLLAAPRGIDAMHGGVLVGTDGAWAVIGPKEGGKSTLLARCARDGATVLSDDVVALDGTLVLAGPRCIDLRESSAALGPGVPVRRGTRLRLRVPPAPAEVELAGFLHLAWGDEAEPCLAPIPPFERLARLAALRAEEGWQRDRSLVLELAARPAYELRRPRGLESLEATAALVTDRLGLTPAPAGDRASA